jgi:hypothetical protein
MPVLFYFYITHTQGDHFFHKQTQNIFKGQRKWEKLSEEEQGGVHSHTENLSLLFFEIKKGINLSLSNLHPLPAALFLSSLTTHTSVMNFSSSAWASCGIMWHKILDSHP